MAEENNRDDATSEAGRTSKITYIVICWRIVEGGPGKWFNTEYDWDRMRFDTREAAVDHGFGIRSSDDFNVGVMDGHKLISFEDVDGVSLYFALDDVAACLAA